MNLSVHVTLLPLCSVIHWCCYGPVTLLLTFVCIYLAVCWFHIIFNIAARRRSGKRPQCWPRLHPRAFTDKTRFSRMREASQQEQQEHEHEPRQKAMQHMQNTETRNTNKLSRSTDLLCAQCFKRSDTYSSSHGWKICENLFEKFYLFAHRRFYWKFVNLGSMKKKKYKCFLPSQKYCISELTLRSLNSCPQLNGSALSAI